MSVMEVNEAAIIVVREHLKTSDYDEHFFDKVEQVLSIFNGELESDIKIEEKPIEMQSNKKVNPFKNYKI